MPASLAISHSAQALTSPACLESVETLGNRRNENRFSSSGVMRPMLAAGMPFSQVEFVKRQGAAMRCRMV
jgi:hypothetical protein